MVISAVESAEFDLGFDTMEFLVRVVFMFIFGYSVSWLVSLRFPVDRKLCTVVEDFEEEWEEWKEEEEQQFSAAAQRCPKAEHSGGGGVFGEDEQEHQKQVPFSPVAEKHTTTTSEECISPSSSAEAVLLQKTSTTTLLHIPMSGSSEEKHKAPGSPSGESNADVSTDGESGETMEDSDDASSVSGSQHEEVSSSDSEEEKEKANEADLGQEEQEKDVTVSTIGTAGAGAWRSRRSLNGQDAEENPDDKARRLVRSVLNKLTAEKYGSLFQQLVSSCNVETEAQIAILAAEIFEKATTQHHLVQLYADLCANLETEAPFAKRILQEKTSFKRILLEQCQASFERNLRAAKPTSTVSCSEDSDLLEEHLKQKERMLGNVKFIGELTKRRMLSPKIVFLCVEELLLQKTEASLETLCVLLESVCPVLDVPAWPLGQKQFAATFQTLARMSEADEHSGATVVSTRIRCLIKNLLEKKARSWAEKTPSPSSGALSEPGDGDDAARPRHRLWQNTKKEENPGSRSWTQLREGGSKLRDTAPVTMRRDVEKNEIRATTAPKASEKKSLAEEKNWWATLEKAMGPPDRESSSEEDEPKKIAGAPGVRGPRTLIPNREPSKPMVPPPWEHRGRPGNVANTLPAAFPSLAAVNPEDSDESSRSPALRQLPRGKKALDEARGQLKKKMRETAEADRKARGDGSFPLTGFLLPDATRVSGGTKIN